MENREYFVRRAWDCHRLAGQCTDVGVAKLMRDTEHDFIARAIGVGVPLKALPPQDEIPETAR